MKNRHLRIFQRNILHFLVPLTLLGVSVGSYAQSEGGPPPNREKCTCNTGSTIARNGASVVNAALCLQRMNPNRKWCDFRVVSIKGQSETKRVINLILNWKNESGGGGFSGYLYESLEKFVEQIAQNSANDKSNSINQLREEVNYVLSQIKEFSPQIMRCIDYYEVGKPYSSKFNFNRGGCQVSSRTKWLHINVFAGKTEYVFSIQGME